jgi:hypothetical protein
VPKTTTTPKANGTAAIGTETAYAAGDHVHPTDTTRAATTHSHAWADVTGKPATFPPSAHNHSIANIADLQSSLGNAFVAVTKYGQSTVILRLTRASGSYVDVILSEEDNSAGN